MRTRRRVLTAFVVGAGVGMAAGLLTPARRSGFVSGSQSSVAGDEDSEPRGVDEVKPQRTAAARRRSGRVTARLPADHTPDSSEK